MIPPLISCIMPTYNRRPFIPHAIDYFLRQTYDNRELIILDDGEDSIVDLVPSDPRIRYERLPQKITLGAKLNLGCELARGELIAHFDDDDWYAPRRLAYQAEALARESAAICGINNLLYFDLRDGRAYEYRYPQGSKTFLLGSDLFYTKDFWSGHRFADVNVGMDGLFVRRAPAGAVSTLDDNRFAVHLVHGRNVSPKQVADALWRPHPVEDIANAMGDDWAYYRPDNAAAAGLPRPRAGATIASTIDAQAADADFDPKAVSIGVYVDEDGPKLSETLRVLEANTPPGVEILLLADCPDAALREALSGLAQYRQFVLLSRRGAPACFNTLVQEGRGEIFVFLESGALVAPGWLKGVVEALQARPANGLAGPSTNRSWNMQQVFPGEANATNIDAVAWRISARYGAGWRTMEPLYCLADFCYAVKRDAVFAIGAADEAYGGGPCWEMDYTIRAARSGYRPVWAQGAYVFRLPPSALRQEEESRRFEASKRLYQDRFCGRRLRRESCTYKARCRGDECENFAPSHLVRRRLPFRAPATAKDSPSNHDVQADAAATRRVSCVMPTSNRRPFLRLALMCFEAQDYRNKELIIVNDRDDVYRRPFGWSARHPPLVSE